MKQQIPHFVWLKLLAQNGIPAPTAEYRFHPTRKFRFDWCWPEYLIAVEVEGGVWTRGRHTRGAGFLRDCFKYNEAALLGWIVLRTTPDKLYSTEVCEMIKRALELRRAAA